MDIATVGWLWWRSDIATADIITMIATTTTGDTNVMIGIVADIGEC